LTGTLISGCAALQFFDCIIYDDLDLDLYVHHKSASVIAYWLQSIGYNFIPNKTSHIQTLEMALNKQPSFERYTFTVIVLDFKKTNHPLIHVIASKGPALEMVLDFEHSESCAYFYKLFTNLSTSFYNELHNSQ